MEVDSANSSFQSLVTIALEVTGEGASVEASDIAFDDNYLAKTESESPENPNGRKHPEHLTESRVHLTHDQTETPVEFAVGLAKTSIDGLAWYVKAALVVKGEGIGFNVKGEVGIDTYRNGCSAYKVAQRILRQKQPENTFFTKSEVHIHMPKADGPSAGCTMATSLLSLAMKKPVRKDLAMTGEITPTGRILAIGSVKEKTIGARRSQVKTIIFPEANRRDMDELAENLKEGLNVHFVDEYEQIFELAFNYDD